MNTFLMVAMRHYEGSITDVKEFEEDLEIFTLLNKMFSRYENSKKTNVRLILNYIIILHNLFSVATTRLLFMKIPEERWSILATYLKFLNYLPAHVFIDGRYYHTEDIMFDDEISKELEAI